MPTIVKRKGHTEKFDERKVYGSVYAACASAHYNKLKCEAIADSITKKIKQFIKNKKRVDSLDIRKKVESELKKKEDELAFFYEHNLPNLKQL